MIETKEKLHHEIRTSGQPRYGLNQRWTRLTYTVKPKSGLTSFEHHHLCRGNPRVEYCHICVAYTDPYFYDPEDIRVKVKGSHEVFELARLFFSCREVPVIAECLCSRIDQSKSLYLTLYDQSKDVNIAERYFDLCQECYQRLSVSR